MKPSMAKIIAVFATGTALLGSCCALPLLLMGLGVGSAGFSSALAPFRPYLIGITCLLLGIAFVTAYGRAQTCEGQGVCTVRSMRRARILLWVSTGLALLLLIGPNLITQATCP